MRFSRDIFAGLSGLEGITGTVVQGSNGTLQLKDNAGNLYNWNSRMFNMAPGEQVTAAEDSVTPVPGATATPVSLVPSSGAPSGAVPASASSIPAYSGTMNPWEKDILTEVQNENPFYAYLSKYYPGWEDYGYAPHHVTGPFRGVSLSIGHGPVLRPGQSPWLGLSGVEDDIKGFYAEHSNVIKIGAALLGAALLFQWLPGKRR
ncbi:MAG: hypothetical protein M0Z52_07320 [Actinomycetota bacterium]|nr:hypothetical protein [Actinomycetota bacterium]